MAWSGQFGWSTKLAVGATERLIDLVAGEDGVCDPLGITLAGPGGGRVVAIVEWGGGGTTATVEIDFLDGVTFTIACKSLRLDAKNEGATSIARVGAFAAIGPTHRTSPLTRTRYLDGAGPATWIVPAFAQSLAVVRAPALAPCTVQILDGSAAVIGEQLVVTGADHVPTTLPQDRVRVVVTGGAPPLAFARGVFGLSIS